MLTTFDNNQLLHFFHNSHASKSKTKTNKINMNRTVNFRKAQIYTQVVNEDEINQLFQKKIQKICSAKVDDVRKSQIKICYGTKDYIPMINMFKGWNNMDRLLSGLPENIYKIGQTNFEQIDESENSPTNLTKQFKQKYLIGKIIGEGAYASVRIAICKQTQQRVAIKVYQKTRLQKPERKKSLIRQIRILSYMNHQNIVKIIDVAQTNNHLNIIMQYLNGISLSQYLKKSQTKKLNQQQCKIIIRGLASALQHMNTLNISHRDIKVQNVLLDKNLNPKLIDFGFSTCIQKNKKIQIFCGTPNYMAPQIILRKQFCGMKADIWALGVLFYIIATGTYPFRGCSDQQLYHKIKTLDYPKPKIQSKQIQELISMMLQFEPDQRITPINILNHPWISGIQKKQTSTSKNKYLILAQNNLLLQLSQDKRKRVQTTLSTYTSNQQNMKIKNIKNIEKRSTKNYFNHTLKQKDLNKLLQTSSKKKQSSFIKTNTNTNTNINANTNTNTNPNTAMKKSKNTFTLKKQLQRLCSKSKEKQNIKQKYGKIKKLNKSKSKTKLI